MLFYYLTVFSLKFNYLLNFDKKTCFIKNQKKIYRKIWHSLINDVSLIRKYELLIRVINFIVCIQNQLFQ